jgi:hypothetical protein
MSQCSDRLMTTGRYTSDRRCEDHDMSPRSDRRMKTCRDTSDRRCEDRDMSPSSDHLMITDGDTSGEGVKVMIGAQFQNTLEPM